MRLKTPSVWQWNDRSLDRVQASERFAVPRDVPVSIGKTPEVVQVGHYLVEIASVFKELRIAYMGEEERRKLSDVLFDSFVHLQFLSGASDDWELRQVLCDYLVSLGSVGVRRGVAGQEQLTRTSVLVEALARGRVEGWLQSFYNGLRHLSEIGPSGRPVTYEVPKRLLEGEWNGRNRLLHWVEQRESR